MAEPKRLDNEFNLPEPTERDRELRDPGSRPQLLRNETRVPIKTGSLPLSRSPDETIGKDYPGDDSPAPSAPSVTQVEAVQLRQEATTPADRPALLFGESEVSDYRSRWSDIQAAFVDEPRQAVEDADSLVKSLLKKLSEGFTNERDRLAKQWDRGDDVSTEDLRISLQRYRSFFDRLLNV